MSLVVLKDVKKSYPLGKRTVEAIGGISYTFEKGTTLVKGASGSGKSTLLQMIGCLDHPTEGTIHFMGENVTSLRESELSQLRRRSLGFIFQGFYLLPQLNLADNIGYPLNRIEPDKKKKNQRVSRLLEEVGLGGYEKRFPRELSGGERQRVAIARALVASPGLIIADEPTANLDSVTGTIILDLLARLERTEDVSLIISSHDGDVIERISRQLTIKDGRIDSEK